MGDNGKRATYTKTMRVRIDEETFNTLSTVALKRGKKPSTLGREIIRDALRFMLPENSNTHTV